MKGFYIKVTDKKTSGACSVDSTKVDAKVRRSVKLCKVPIGCNICILNELPILLVWSLESRIAIRPL